MADGPFIYRFGKDLRLDDHAGLAAASSRGAVLPLLAVDPPMEARLRASPRRAAFFCGAVRALDEELRERGSRLIVRRAGAEAAVLGLAREAGAAGAAWSASYDDAGMRRDESLREALERAGLQAVVVHDSPAVAPEESAGARSAEGPGYRAFSPYFEVWRELPIASHESPLLLRFAGEEIDNEGLPHPAEFGVGDPPGGGGSAVARRLFATFLRERAPQYAIDANVPAEDGTSGLSAHLSFGTISARSIALAVRGRLADPFSIGEQRLSMRLFLRALAHRDFFLQLSWFNPQTHDEPLQGKMRGFRWERSHAGLDAWRAGATGFPLVDAGIRQLHRTGWMHPHVRAVAASTLCFDLGVDWRVGRAEWDRWLIEDDPAIATGNWQWIAGVGADMAQYPRIYNPERQLRRYDPAGLYVRRWIDELRGVPLEAWQPRAKSTGQLRLALFAEGEYPPPVVDHAVAARSFLRRYREFVSP
ncbi:MAG: deoxyribodipyrimidine photo-lyase [Candidatus Eremiobacteraeota bacterium]|nr:deoxyribodipyrimidine photo-lyase [Candidatus Eremiobacteraeota bacterium]MBV8499224.1 deoxyribodipyrimidine photo-lyase [Candidatus Eremiobacteraeota bacterium]